MVAAVEIKLVNLASRKDDLRNMKERFTYDSIHPDHLGSWEKVLDENKNTVQQTQIWFSFDRGFTGHEHYDFVHVINANARLYDPVIGRT